MSRWGRISAHHATQSHECIASHTIIRCPSKMGGVSTAEITDNPLAINLNYPDWKSRAVYTHTCTCCLSGFGFRIRNATQRYAALRYTLRRSSYPSLASFSLLQAAWFRRGIVRSSGKIPTPSLRRQGWEGGTGTQRPSLVARHMPSWEHRGVVLRCYD